MVGEVVAPQYRQASIMGVEGPNAMGGEGACEVKHQTDQGKGDLYNPNELLEVRGYGTFRTRMYPGCQSDPSHRQASPHTGSRDPGREVIIDRVFQQVDEGTEKARHSAG